MVKGQRVYWKGLIYSDIYFGDKYQINTKGYIRNKKTKRMLKQSEHYGTLYSHISVDGQSIRINIIEAVAETFSISD